MTKRVREIDRGWGRIERDMRAVARHRVAVGYPGTVGAAGHDGAGTTVAQVATWHEFGTEDLPERSHLRSTVDAHEREYRRLAGHLRTLMVRGALSPRAALSLFGERVRADIRRAIQHGIPPPLKQATVDRKQSSKPLIDTGQLVNSITYEVRDR